MNQFGGSAQEDYGFFAPTRASSSGSQFGGAPATVGASPTGSVGGFGAPAAYGSVSTPASPRRTAAKLLGVLVLVGLLAVGGWFGWIRYQLGRPLVVPATLSAMPPVEGAKVAETKASVEQQWRAENPDTPLAFEVYAGHKRAIILAMARGHVDVEKDFADAGFSGDLQPVGHAECAQVQDGLVACERATRTLSAMVVVFNGSVHDAAAALDEAWAQQ